MTVVWSNRRFGKWIEGLRQSAREKECRELAENCRHQCNPEMSVGLKRDTVTVHPRLTAPTINLCPSSRGMKMRVWSILLSFQRKLQNAHH
jgi:hypothetical protein